MLGGFSIFLMFAFDTLELETLGCTFLVQVWGTSELINIYEGHGTLLSLILVVFVHPNVSTAMQLSVHTPYIRIQKILKHGECEKNG